MSEGMASPSSRCHAAKTSVPAKKFFSFLVVPAGVMCVRGDGGFLFVS